MERRHAWSALAAAAVVCAAIVLGRPNVGGGALFPDSYAYIDWPSDFMLPGRTRVLGARPIGYALFLDVFGTGLALVWAQTVLAFVSWALLGWVAGGLAGTVAGCAIALAAPVWRWNACVLSESFSLSLMALSLAITLVWAERAARERPVDWKIPVAWSACTLLFGWSRDANLVLVPALLLPWFWVDRRDRVLIASVAGLALAVGAVESVRNDRSVWSLTNAIIARVLPDHEAVACFSDAGMPFTDGVRAAAGDPGSRTQRALRASDPAFVEWIERHGAGTYWRWVLGRSGCVSEVGAAIAEHDGSDLPAYPAKLELPAAVDAAQRALAEVPPLWATWLLPLFALAAYRFERRLRPSLVAALLASAVALVYDFVSFHADAVEVHRHMLLGLVLQRAAFLVGLAGMIAVLVARRRERATDPVQELASR